jgi:uncharacterized membrane protein YdbT with pleckstrin-like domain
MRCPQCGTEAAIGAAFCSRCGTRLMMPRPETRREFALARVAPSWWRFAGSFSTAIVLAALAVAVLYGSRRGWPLAAALIALSWIVIGLAVMARHSINWSLTSERLIERRGILSQRRREVELADIRSVEVDRRLLQRLIGIGNVVVSSAASADFTIRLEDVADPERIAETLRKARLKRLA